MNRQFIMVFREGTPLNTYTFHDLYDDERVIILDSIFKKRDNDSRIMTFFRKIHLSGKVNKVIKLPFKRIWGYSLENISWNENTEYFIIFMKMYPIEPSYLVKLQKKHRIKYIMCLEDPIDDPIYSPYQRYVMSKMKFEYIFTFDNADATKYNYIFYDMFYSMFSKKTDQQPEYDLYYTGYNKGRLKIIVSIYKYMKEKSVSCKFRIGDVPDVDQQFSNEIIYNKKIPYSEVVEESMKSNCILELLTDLQSGATLRYYEAVCYNKKLLTNNKNAVNLPFYNPDYIHVFENPEDIDWEWVKERIPVDYHYDGRFSPTHLIDKIIELEEEKERKQDGEKEAT